LKGGKARTEEKTHRGCDDRETPAYSQHDADRQMGDVWTWVALDAESKLVGAWYIRDRDSEAAMFFMDNFAKRLANRIQLTSDGHRPYLEAVEGAFGADIDYAMLVKIYGVTEGKGPEKRYSPAQCLGARKHAVEGKPDKSKVSTSYVERNNGIIRQHCKRYARLTQAFSKKIENHVYAFALHTMYHNFVKISGAHRMTPAQAAGVDSRLWEMSDIVKVIEDWEDGREH
jgi:IS1 family transposase